MRVAIQGFGNVGSWAARLLFEQGARVVAVPDTSGAVRDADGLDAPALLEHKRLTRGVGGEAMSSRGAPHVRVRGPGTPEADEVFRRLQQYRWTEERVDQELRTRMLQAWKDLEEQQTRGGSAPGHLPAP